MAAIHEQLEDARERLDAESITASDYGVVVRGLPTDCTVEEVRAHFNELYRLDKVQSYDDWPSSCFERWKTCKYYRKAPDQQRHKSFEHQRAQHSWEPAIEGTAFVSPESYAGKWVSEVVLAYRNGRSINQITTVRNTSAKVDALQIKIRKFREDSPFVKRPRIFGGKLPCCSNNPAKYKAKMQKYEKKLAELEAEVATVSKTMSPIIYEPPNANELERCKTEEEREHLRRQGKVCLAFVTFENTESQLRCIADHAPFRSSCLRWRQSRKLRFKGESVLTVERAPEPETILWQNLEACETTPLDIFAAH